MRSFFAAIKSISSTIFVLAFVAALLLMFLAAPLELLIESYDLAQMQSVAEGKITRSEVLHQGDLSRSIVEYTFSVDNQNFNASRVSPQYFLTDQYSDDGHVDSELYQLGQKVTVHFDADTPERSALVYGWSKVPLGFMLFVFGGLTLGCTKGWKRLALGSLVLYGFGLLAWGPEFVLVHQLHNHLLAVLLCGVFFWLCPGLFKPTKQNKESRPKFSVNLEF